MTIVCEKGAISSILAGIDTLPLEYTLFEIIDNRHHSKSNKFFIDIDAHNKRCVIGYDKEATDIQIDNLVKYYNIDNTHKEGTRVASRAVGSKLWTYRCRGDHTFITKIYENKYFKSGMDTQQIYNAEIDRNVSNSKFSEILINNTRSVSEEDELVSSELTIIENKEGYYPFTPKTVFIRKDSKKNTVDENNCFEYFGNEIVQDSVVKRLQIKYYKEIFESGLELYIKLPKYKTFEKINLDKCVDVIGYTNNFSNKHKINIYIDSKYHYGYVFSINDKYYKYDKNGNSVLCKKIDDYNNKEPDFCLEQYNVDIPNDKKKTSIVGNSLETYAGLYIWAGETFISSEKVNWNVGERNLGGHKDYRAVLTVLTNKGKNELGFSGLKAQFNLSNKRGLHDIIKQFTEIYKKYLKNDMPGNPDEYVVIKSTAEKSEPNKRIEGGAYCMKIGDNFYKVGIWYSNKKDSKTNKKRTDDYYKKEIIEANRNDFPNEQIYDKPCKVFEGEKIKNISLFEEEMKRIINESSDCQTYDNKRGGDNREYFHCNNFYESVLPQIIDLYENWDNN